LSKQIKEVTRETGPIAPKASGQLSVKATKQNKSKNTHNSRHPAMLALDLANSAIEILEQITMDIVD
jgi:hypothetical protein